MIKNIWNFYTEKLGRTIFHPQFIMLNFAYEAIKEVKKKNRGNLVDIGCGRMPYKEEVLPFLETYTGVDKPETAKLYLSNEKPDVFAQAEKLPFENSEFDTVLMLQVLEYLEDPKKAILESSRILKKGGSLILTAPFLYPIHDAPYDMARYTETSIRYLLDEAGFENVKITPQGNFFDSWIQLLNVYLFRFILDTLSGKGGIMSWILLPVVLVITPIKFITGNLVALILRPVVSLLGLPNYFPLNFLVTANKKN